MKALRVEEGKKKKENSCSVRFYLLSLIFLSSIKLPSSLLHPNPFCLSSKKVATSPQSQSRVRTHTHEQLSQASTTEGKLVFLSSIDVV